MYGEAAGDVVRVLKENGKLKKENFAMKEENQKLKAQESEWQKLQAQFRQKDDEIYFLRKSLNDIKAAEMDLKIQNANLEKEIFELKEQIDMDLESKTSGSSYSDKSRISEIPTSNESHQDNDLQLKVSSLSVTNQILQQQLQQLEEQRNSEKIQLQALISQQKLSQPPQILTQSQQDHENEGNVDWLIEQERENKKQSNREEQIREKGQTQNENDYINILDSQEAEMESDQKINHTNSNVSPHQAKEFNQTTPQGQTILNQESNNKEDDVHAKEYQSKISDLEYKLNECIAEIQRLKTENKELMDKNEIMQEAFDNQVDILYQEYNQQLTILQEQQQQQKQQQQKQSQQQQPQQQQQSPQKQQQNMSSSNTNNKNIKK